MINKELLLSEFNASTKDLQNGFLQFTNDTFNQQPSSSEWSGAQIGEHLLLMEVLATRALTGATVATNRPADEKMAIIKCAMLDETKRNAPDIVSPGGSFKDVQESTAQLIQQRETLKNAIADSDLSEACISFKHPALGTLTKFEWTYFIIYHTQRHLHQLDKVRKRILHP